MTLKALVPAHFVDELREPARAIGATLIGYDQHAVPAEPCRDAVALFRWWLSSEAGDRLVREHPALRWVHTGSAGVDHILTPSFRASGITLTNSAGVHAPSIAEWVVALILAEAKGLDAIFGQQREHVWKATRSEEIGGRHALILGGGQIAREIASRLRAMGVRVTAVTRSGLPSGDFDAVAGVASLRSLCGSADWLILAAPLTEETRGIISAGMIAALPSRARIVNVARGELVDERAMLEALTERRIAGAILDVFEQEPLPADHPFWAMDSVRVLPHTTWRSEQVHARQLALFLDNLGRYVRGEPLRNIVDPTRGY
ncbi:MAG: D-2-hydroxyacid dehydrogenase [Thermoanaerobaculia bacterium]|nr:D-2-hydroxyacid dehydrogenase [Thermoanaerobaculia bacterium]